RVARAGLRVEPAGLRHVAARGRAVRAPRAASDRPLSGLVLGAHAQGGAAGGGHHAAGADGAVTVLAVDRAVRRGAAGAEGLGDVDDLAVHGWGDGAGAA